MDAHLNTLFSQEAYAALSRGDARTLAAVMESGALGPEANIARLLADHFAGRPDVLNDDMRALLASKLAAGGIGALDKADEKRVYELIRHADLHKQLQSIDQKLKTYLYPQMAAWPICVEAGANWDSWDTDQKLKYGRVVARQFSRIADLPCARLEAHPDLEVSGKQAAATCAPIRGQRHHLIKLNEHMAFDSKLLFDELLYHELTHTVHFHLASAAKDGTLDRIAPALRTPAILIAVMRTKRFYDLIIRDYAAYRAYPMEKHAHDNAEDFAKALSDPARVARMAAEHDKRLARAMNGPLVRANKPQASPV